MASRTDTEFQSRLTANRSGRGRAAAAVAVQMILVGGGLGLIAFAVHANAAWQDRHILPHMFLSRTQQILWWEIERGAAVLTGLALVLFVGPRTARLIHRGKGAELAIQCMIAMLAIGMSIVVSEAILRASYWEGVDRWAAGEEPLRAQDTYLGWRNMAGRTGREAFNGREILYHIDPAGYRVGAPGRAIDYARPSILLAGESIMLGFRLNWPETVAGQLQAITRIQSANLAVNGYGTDQAFMHLMPELSRFTRPVAVVALFAPTLLERNLDDDRPHLDAALRWTAPRRYWRLQHLMKNVFLYRSDRSIDQGIAMTRNVLRTVVLQAHARHAAALILVPFIGPEQPAEREIRRRVLDDAALPYVLVPLDPSWRLAHDGHPDARANLKMTRAILAGLEHQRPDLFEGRH
jgi:hypothetical protein